MELKLRQVYQDDYIRVEVQDERQFIFLTWLQHPGSAAFRSSFRVAADLIIANQSRYWLSDARAIHYLEFADQNWLLQEMAPLLQFTNLRRFARITSPETYALLDLERVLVYLESIEMPEKVEMEIFTEEAEAWQWVLAELPEVLMSFSKVLVPANK